MTDEEIKARARRIKVESTTTDKQDLNALKLLDANRIKAGLDKGGLDDRYTAADSLTKELFEGTKYCIQVEEYCYNCTVSALYKDPKGVEDDK